MLLDPMPFNRATAPLLIWECLGEDFVVPENLEGFFKAMIPICSDASIRDSTMRIHLEQQAARRAQGMRLHGHPFEFKREEDIGNEAHLARHGRPEPQVDFWKHDPETVAGRLRPDLKADFDLSWTQRLPEEFDKIICSVPADKREAWLWQNRMWIQEIWWSIPVFTASELYWKAKRSPAFSAGVQWLWPQWARQWELVPNDSPLWQPENNQQVAVIVAVLQDNWVSPTKPSLPGDPTLYTLLPERLQFEHWVWSLDLSGRRGVPPRGFPYRYFPCGHPAPARQYIQDVPDRTDEYCNICSRSFWRPDIRRIPGGLTQPAIADAPAAAGGLLQPVVAADAGGLRPAGCSNPWVPQPAGCSNPRLTSSCFPCIRCIPALQERCSL